MKVDAEIKMGVVGVGHLGLRHAEAISGMDDVVLSGIYDTRREVADEAGSYLSCRVFQDYDSLLGSVDAVSVVVPTDRHFDVATRALDAGRHVLVEKPITENLDEAAALVQQARERRLVLQVGHVERFNPAFSLAREFIVRPMFIESHRLAPFVKRGTEVDVILDLMIHDIDLVLSVMGSEIREIWAVGVPVITPSVDIANVRLTFSGHRAVSLTASRISTKRMRKLRVFQQDMYISMDFLMRRSEIYRIERRGEAPLFQEKILEDDGSVNPLANEIAAFAESVRNGRTLLGVTGEEAMKAMEYALKIRECMVIPPRDTDGVMGKARC